MTDSDGMKELIEKAQISAARRIKILAEQPPFTFKEAKAQVERIKKESQSKGKKGKKE